MGLGDGRDGRVGLMDVVCGLWLVACGLWCVQHTVCLEAWVLWRVACVQIFAAGFSACPRRHSTDLALRDRLAQLQTA